MPLATKTSQRSDPSPSRVRLGPHRPYFTGGWFIGCSKFSTFLNYKCCCLHPNPRKNITTPGSKWIFNSKLRVSHNLCHRGNSYSNISFKDPNAISVIHLGTILDEGIVKEVAVETDLTTGGVGGVHGVRVPAKPQSTRGKSSTNNIFFHNKAVVACCYQQYIQHIPIYHIPQMLTCLSLMVKPHYQMPHVLRKSSTECDCAHHDMWTGLAHQQKEAFQEGHLSFNHPVEGGEANGFNSHGET